MRPFEFRFQATDGLTLHGYGWEPEDEASGVIDIVHGLGEHGGRYATLAENFVRAGCAVMTFDLRGHGHSEGRRGHAAGYDLLMSDITGFLKESRERFSRCPQILYGHSLGGNLVINYVLDYQPRVSGVIATSPLLRRAADSPAWKTAMLRALSLVWPTLSLSNGIDSRDLSRDPEVVAAYDTDPLVHDRITARMAVDILHRGLSALENAADLSPPMLLLHGDGDRITSAAASREFAAAAGQCELRTWPGLGHELHNEPEREEVLACLMEWTEKRIPPEDF